MSQLMLTIVRRVVNAFIRSHVPRSDDSTADLDAAISIRLLATFVPDSTKGGPW